MLKTGLSAIDDANSVIKLFYYMQETYSIFEDIKLGIVYREQDTQSQITTWRLNDDAQITMNMKEEDIAKSMKMKECLEACKDELSKINPNLNYLQFTLLHELGHYLHNITEPEDFNDACTEKDILVELEDEKIGLTQKQKWDFYRLIPIEAKADKYAEEMALVLLTDENFKNYKSDYEMEKPKTLKERIIEEFPDLKNRWKRNNEA